MNTVESVAPGGRVNLSDAPAGLDDATFDSLFPAEPTPVATPVPVTPAAPLATNEPASQTTAEPFLKGDRSIYNTPEAARDGINQKDALIENLRQRYALTTGIDPITGQPVQALAPQQPQGIDYTQAPDKYLSDLYEAAKSGRPNAYADVQQKFLMDTLKPLQPVLQRAAREQAIEAVSQDTKGIAEFINTSQYSKTLDQVPELKDAIRMAETDYRLHSRLPGLYKIAYLAGQGVQLPEILQAQAKTNPPPAPRPTMQLSTPPLPQSVSAKPSFKTIDGIRSVIAEAEARGAKLDF